MPKGAGGPIILPCTNRLCGVFDHQEVVLASESVDRTHICHLPKQMHGCDDASFVGDGCRDFTHINVERVGLNIDKNWLSAEPRNRPCCTEEGVRGGDDFIAFANAHRHHGNDQSVGTRGDADGVLGITIVNAGGFELFNRRPEDEILGRNDVGHCRIELGLKCEILWL